jgi:hypothetical protein
MDTGQHYWWNKSPGVRHNVELIINSPVNLPVNMLATGPLPSNAVMIRVLSGAFQGRYAMVDPADLSVG